MRQKRPLCSLILAAGKGTRIGLTNTHKTCLPAAGKPIVLRTIETLRNAGVSPHVVVVGTGAQYVLGTVGSAFPDAVFAYQPEPLGTGNAAKCGARVLNSIGYNGDVLIVAGDKLIDSKVMTKMTRKFRSLGLDCLFVVGRREDSPGSGRVIFDENNRPVRIIEMPDIRRARALSHILDRAQSGQVSREFVAEAIAAEAMGPEKARLAFGALYDFAMGTLPLSSEQLVALVPIEKTFFRVRFGRRTRKISADEADSASYVNLSVYLLRSDALKFAVTKIRADNAQSEEYLTDIVEILARVGKKGRLAYKLGAVRVDDPHQVMGFNTLDELRSIDRYVRQKENRS